MQPGLLSLCSPVVSELRARSDSERARRQTWLVGAAIVLAVAVLFIGLAADSQPASAAITGSPIYWGAFLPGSPYSEPAMNAFEAGIGKGQSIVHWGQGWVSGTNPQVFQTNLFERV